MSFVLPQFKAPDFSKPPFSSAPPVRTEKAPSNGVAPASCHGTSNHPEYVHLGDGRWILVPESRMDCVLVVRGVTVEATEARRLKQGDMVIIGRTENSKDGIFVHTGGFETDSQECAICAGRVNQR